MALKRQFEDYKLKDDINDFSFLVSKIIINNLIISGELFVEQAREQPQDHSQGFYIDRTGRLRNSIGYFVYAFGEKMASNAGAFGGQMEVMIQPYVDPGVFQLIGYAGMDYASYVQAKGYNVILNQSEVCIIKIQELMAGIEQSINTAIHGQQ